MIPSELLQRRPDIAAAERRVAAANEQIGIARSAYFPSITLGANEGLAAGSVAALASNPVTLWSIGVSLTQTIFDAGLVKNRIAGAEAVGAHKTSMLQDVEAGRPIEIDGILGAVVEAAEACGCPAPLMSATYALVRKRADVLGLLPALQRPTISALSDDDWVAVNTIIEERTVRDLIPKLKAARAQGIVEYPLNKIVL
mgnify:CR=1 FL=1